MVLLQRVVYLSMWINWTFINIFGVDFESETNNNYMRLANQQLANETFLQHPQFVNEKENNSTCKHRLEVLVNTTGYSGNWTKLLHLYSAMCPAFEECNSIGRMSFFSFYREGFLRHAHPAISFCNCSCKYDCIFERNCCPGNPHGYLPYACEDVSLYPEGSHDDYFMVSSCPETFTNDADTERKCNGAVAPVTSLTRNITYKNAHCARCNGVNDVTTWNVSVTCDKTPQGLFKTASGFYDVMKEYGCKARLSLNDNSSAYLPVRCSSREKASPKTIFNSCNMTGLLIKSDEDVQWACEHLNGRFFEFKNIFCYLCNPSIGSQVEVTVDRCSDKSRSPALDRLCLNRPNISRTAPFKNIHCLICNNRSFTHNRIKQYSVEEIITSLNTSVVKIHLEIPDNLAPKKIRKLNSIYQNTSFNVLHYSPTGRLNLDKGNILELKSSYIDACGDTCPDNNNETSTNDLSGRIPMCSRCSCATDCLDTDNCCPDLILKTEPYTCSSSYKRMILNGNDKLTHSFGTTSAFYRVIDRCLDKTSKLIHECEPDTNGTSDISAFIPITVYRKSSTIYKNIHCYFCNHADGQNGNFISINITLNCRALLEPYLFTDLVTLLTASKQYCSTSFVPESGEQCRNFTEQPIQYTDYMSNVKTYARHNNTSYNNNNNTYTSCNQTGFWNEFSEVISMVCEGTTESILALPLYKYNFTLYKNFACFICNPESLWFDNGTDASVTSTCGTGTTDLGSTSTKLFTVGLPNETKCDDSSGTPCTERGKNRTADIQCCVDSNKLCTERGMNRSADWADVDNSRSLLNATSVKCDAGIIEEGSAHVDLCTERGLNHLWPTFKNFFCADCNLAPLLPIYNSPIWQQGQGGAVTYNIFSKTPFPLPILRPKNVHGTGGSIVAPTFRYLFAIDYHEWTTMETRVKVNATPCTNGTFDRILKSCRPLFCEAGRVLENNTCHVTSEVAANVNYLLQLKITPLSYNNDNETVSLPMICDDVMKQCTENFDVTTDVNGSSCNTSANVECSFKETIPMANLSHVYVSITIRIGSTHNLTLVESELTQCLAKAYTIMSDNNETLTFESTPVSDYEINNDNENSDIDETNGCSGHFGSNSMDPLALAVDTSSWVSHMMMCPQIELSLDEFEFDNETGTVFIEHYNTNRSGSEFEWTDSSNSPNSSIRVCQENARYVYNVTYINGPDNRLQVALEVFSRVSVAMSLIGLATTFATYCIFPSLRSLPGKNIMTLTVNLFIAQALLEFGSEFAWNMKSCVVTGVLLHYFWLASFFAMNICSYHMLNIFCINVFEQHSYIDDRALFLKYITYVMGSPFVVIITTMTVHLVLSKGSFMGYGVQRCFLGDIYSLSVAFLAPSSIIFITNIAFFLAVAKQIRKRPNVAVTNKHDFLICVKLCAIVGVAWPLQIIDGTMQMSYLSFIATGLNGFQGVYIFMSYVCNGRVLGRYRSLVSRCRGTGRKQSMSGFSTGEPLPSPTSTTESVSL